MNAYPAAMKPPAAVFIAGGMKNLMKSSDWMINSSW